MTPAISQDQSNFHKSINQYYDFAVDLKAELVKAFHWLRNKTGKEFWKPLDSLQLKDDIPKLDGVIKKVYKNIENLCVFDPNEKSKHLLNKLKRSVDKFVKYILPAWKNFMIATKSIQSVSEHRLV